MKDYKTMTDEVRERINAILKEKGVTQNSVANGDAPAQKRLNSQLSHGATLTLDSVLRVLHACSDISAEWLLRDQGPRLISDIPTDGDSEQILDLKAEVTRREAEVTELREIIQELKAELAKQESRLDKLLDILHQERRTAAPTLSIVAEEPTYANHNNINL
jgi:vacuolar-type H+-ATPase subunit I/STV1